MAILKIKTFVNNVEITSEVFTSDDSTSVVESSVDFARDCLKADPKEVQFIIRYLTSEELEDYLNEVG